MLVSTVPILVTDQGVIADSAAIVAFADSHAPAGRRLMPDEPALRREVEELEPRKLLEGRKERGVLGRKDRGFAGLQSAPMVFLHPTGRG